MSPFAEGAALFAVAWLLARLEIEIEGAHGWAQNLPTWRFSPPWWLELTNGKPMTGYHLYLSLFLLAVLHLPLLYVPFARPVEARILASYFLLTVFWDFQWFVWNPAWGTRRFFSERVWWFPARLHGFPLEYYLGVGASALTVAALWREGLARWAAMAATLGAFSLASAGLRALLAPESAQAAKARPAASSTAS